MYLFIGEYVKIQEKSWWEKQVNLCILEYFIYNIIHINILWEFID